MVRNWQGNDFSNCIKQVKLFALYKKKQTFPAIFNQIRIIFLIFSGVDKKFILLHPLFSKRELENEI
jgi:hypothetical protein